VDDAGAVYKKKETGSYTISTTVDEKKKRKKKEERTKVKEETHIRTCDV